MSPYASIQNLAVVVLIALSLLTVVNSQKCDSTCRGFASMEGGTIGGGSVAAVTVRTIDELRRACSGSRSAVIRISGTIRTGGSALVIGSNKSIIGNRGASIIGGVEVGTGSSNVILRSVSVVGTGFNNAVVVRNRARKVWIDHCDFSDSAKDLLYITSNADLCTVSNNKFRYQQALANRYACTIGEPNVSGIARVTVHDNNFADNVLEGMTAVYGAQTHVVNNYSAFNGARSGLGIDAKASVLVESNIVLNPNVGLVMDINKRTAVTSGVAVTTKGNRIGGRTNAITSRTGSFTRAPYAFTVRAAADVEASVKSCASVNALSL